MTTRITFLLSLCLCVFIGTTSLVAQENIELATSDIHEYQGYEGDFYIAIDAGQLSVEKKKVLKKEGIQCKGIYNDGTAIILISNQNASDILEREQLTFQQVDHHLKISDELQYSGQTGIAITFHKELTKETITHIKNDFGITDNEFTAPTNRILIGNIEASQLELLANLPEVAYISALVEEPEPLSDDATAFHHAGSIRNPSGLNLQGEGMVVGLGDGGELGAHIDMDDRVINVADGTYATYLDHADKMAGIIAGAGNIDETYIGFAPKATLVTEKTFRIFYYMEDYYRNHGMRLTNNSYGTSFSCGSSGTYDYYSIMLDQQMVDYEDALHIVAVGNSGGNTCNDYPVGYNTVLKTYATAKNVLSVGGVMEDRTRNPISGCGPVADGRIKPEIMTLAEGVATIGNNNNYTTIAGTSSATACATGGTTLLYERYKNNTGENPKGTLLKAILCNTADDAGNEGPDFQYGFGIMNIQQAIDNLDAGHYILGETKTNTPELSYTINVPAGENELKVLLTWNDLPQTINGVATLINDLDLSIIAPDGTSYRPWVLDHNAAGVENLPTRNLDRINNIEQVTIDDPMEGVYTIVVNTFNLESDRQPFAISHTTVHDKLNITFPTEGQSFFKNKPLTISWDASLENVTGFEIDYSADNGSTWTTIGTAEASERFFTWTAPNANIFNAKIRITAIGNGSVSEVGDFHILKSPSGISLTAICGSYVELDWNNVQGAEAFEVFVHEKNGMTLIATTTETEYVAENRMEAGIKYWYSVRAIYENEVRSKRAKAKSVIGVDTYPCPFENAMEITDMEAGEKKGREFTTNSLLETQSMNVHIFNAGTNAVSNIPLKYNVNGVETTEIISTTINAGETYIHTKGNFDFSDAGNYYIKVSTDYEGEGETVLNQIKATCIQLGNKELALPTYEFMENSNPFYIAENTFGVEELPYLDFNTENNAGKINLIDNAGVQGKVLKVINNSYDDYSDIIFTRNLGNTETTFLRFNYKVIVPGPDSEAVMNGFLSNVALSIRSSDTDEWISAGNLDTSGEWFEESQLINISKIVNNAGFTFTPSTQLRFRLSGVVDMELDELSFMSESNILPVEMVSFDARKIEENVLLEWVTASELNNDYFEVQVAKGDEAFRADNFTFLDKVIGKGTTVEETIYAYNDNEEFKYGNRYYRLKQVDFDGTYSYSDVKSVNFEGNSKVEMSVYPNPFVSGRSPNVYFELENDAEVRFIFSDSAGRILEKITGNYTTGGNSFTLDFVEDLEPGVYYLSAILGKNKEVISKILKIND